MLAFLIRTDRCGCLRRPMRMSAPTDTDVCADRCGCLHRPMRMGGLEGLSRIKRAFKLH
ncbi:hypothetical protein [Leyella stercorea]|uniref:hypothetical protein n=1 Tax=Leyella stercorea TaxID=363265 RepID=UPI00242BA3E2|nr:hypothetical protein [Leyella stercorea]